VIEEFMTGVEASFFVLTDGTHALPLATAQDHKRVGEGDTGLNTGGMGAYSPAKIVTPTLLEETMTRIIQPTLTAMADNETPYRGVLYAGLMLTDDGPKLVEYNARFGDPECQVLMLRLKSDLVPALLATAQGDISSLDLEWYDEDAMTVVMAAQGYPGSYPKGSQINNLHAAVADSDTQIFHAGTKTENGKTLAVGGRVLNVTSKGQDLRAARDKAYAALEKIDWQEGFYRRDIGWRVLGKS
ncbi:MAG: phosphoribosylamine--glycine ligase, partial [Pseudomonadota bacterium]|nr:phosphoribosylamine--glycine ligase [Pseudomonadota bacterium]